MSLMQNETHHWQLPNGAQLHSGDTIELYQDGCWMQGEINYHPSKQYQIRLKNGQIVEITEHLTLRLIIPDRRA